MFKRLALVLSVLAVLAGVAPAASAHQSGHQYPQVWVDGKVYNVIDGKAFIRSHPDGNGPLCNGVGSDIWGTDGNDLLIGTDAGEVIQGQPGDDIIKSKGGSDTSCGGQGNDTVWGGSGGDGLFGASGNDDLYDGTGYDDPINGGPDFDTWHICYDSFGGESSTNVEDEIPLEPCSP